ncbi:MAG TPA: cytochrome b/b6 domain-containing protein [Streptosporangiaceae bacterium]|nr:cytochrome b/b6 domain-containing protein [Streptosporangiaceae bacterium]
MTTAVLLLAPARLRGAGARPETDAQTVGLIILAAVTVITAVHASIMIVRHLAAPARGPRRTVRVWDLGVRVSRWSIVASIAVLAVTGYYLAHPIPSQGRGTGNPTVATLRSLHNFFAVLFTAAVLFRVCWFAGNQWASWRYWIPTTRSRLRRLREQAAYYAFIRRTTPAEIGHNPLAGVAYTVLYLILAAQILTGFAASTPRASRAACGRARSAGC